VRYAADRAPALHGVTFEIPAATTLALVGPSGAGKTTVVSALLGFVTPERGRLAIGPQQLDSASPPPGVTIAGGVHLERWRRQITWVPQRPYVFAGTLADNLTLARAGASDRDMFAALDRARLGDLVRTWPAGLQTEVGERGLRLSGGEVRRVALARAFLRDTPLVVLDEPTASLDVATERAVAEAIADLRRGRTVLVVAHRLSTVLGADALVILDAGRIVEAGPPRELAASPGSRFRAMLLAHGGAA
jgi:ATP-binding cassette subfamily C protein CydD